MMNFNRSVNLVESTSLLKVQALHLVYLLHTFVKLQPTIIVKMLLVDGEMYVVFNNL